MKQSPTRHTYKKQRNDANLKDPVPKDDETGNANVILKTSVVLSTDFLQLC